MKTLKDKIFEGRGVEYRVALLCCDDKEGIPMDVTIIVDPSDVKEFEKFLTDEQDNLFMHADGGNVEY